MPRGYAYVLAEMNGTGNSTGCPMHGGPGDVAGMRSVIDWLDGRIVGFTAPDGNAGDRGVDNGSSAMIGKSYDGTLANGVAATGVDGPGDDRPDLGHLGLVPLLAHGRDPVQHELPGELSNW